MKFDSLKTMSLGTAIAEGSSPVSPIDHIPVKTEDFLPKAPRITYSHSSLEDWLGSYDDVFHIVGVADYLYESGFNTNHALASLDSGGGQ